MSGLFAQSSGVDGGGMHLHVAKSQLLMLLLRGKGQLSLAGALNTPDVTL